MQQEQFQKAQHDIFRSLKGNPQLDSSDSGSEELFSSQQRSDVNFSKHPSRGHSCLEYLKEQYGDNAKGMYDFKFGYCSAPTAEIPGHVRHISGSFRDQLNKDEINSGEPENTSNSDIKKSPVEECIQTRAISSTPQAFPIPCSARNSSNELNSVDFLSGYSSIAGITGVETSVNASRTAAGSPIVANALSDNNSKGRNICNCQVESEASFDSDNLNESFKSNMLSGGEEGPGRVRFLSARLPATGKVSSGDVCLSKDTHNLKPILKKEGRSPKSADGDQESLTSRKNVRIHDPVVANIAARFSNQAPKPSARIPGTSCASTSTSPVSEMKSRITCKTATKCTNTNVQEISSLTRNVSVDVDAQNIVCEDNLKEPNVTRSKNDRFSVSPQKQIDSKQQVVKSEKSPNSSTSSQPQGLPTGKSPILPSQLLSPISPDRESKDELIKWNNGVLIHGVGSPMPYDMLSNSPLSDYALKLDNIPTPIQAHAWPAVFRGRDVAAISPSNSGKTQAYLLPIFKALEDHTCYTKLPLSNGVS